LFARVSFKTFDSNQKQMSFISDNIIEIILVAIVTVVAYFFITHKSDEKEEPVTRTTTVTHTIPVEHKEEEEEEKQQVVEKEESKPVVVQSQPVQKQQPTPIVKPISLPPQQDQTPIVPPSRKETVVPPRETTPTTTTTTTTKVTSSVTPIVTPLPISEVQDKVSAPTSARKNVTEEATGAIADRMKHRENKTTVETPRLTMAKKSGLVTPRRNRTLKKDELKKFMEQAENEVKQSQSIDFPTGNPVNTENQKPVQVEKPKKSLADILGRQMAPNMMKAGINLQSITNAKNKLKKTDNIVETKSTTKSKQSSDNDDNVDDFDFKNEYGD
jgi:hypothetical protein